MSRPSLQAIRSAELLGAYEICVARYGLDGATQERIAQQAGVKRTLLRHYLGNKDEMVDALIDHVVTRFDDETDLMIAALPAENQPGALLDILFGPLGITETTSVLSIYALGAASERYPKARKDLIAATERMIDAVTQVLQHHYTQAPGENCRVAAFSICQLYFGIDGMMMLDPPKEWLTQSRQAADIHLRTLEAAP